MCVCVCFLVLRYVAYLEAGRAENTPRGLISRFRTRQAPPDNFFVRIFKIFPVSKWSREQLPDFVDWWKLKVLGSFIFHFLIVVGQESDTDLNPCT